MKRFLSYLSLFVFPVVLLMAPVTLTLLKTGELRPFNYYIKPLQGDQQFGLAYSYYDRAYKFHMSCLMRADVIALGSSRVMEIRQNIINPKYSYYNAGGAIQNERDYRLFLSKLNYTPKVILLGIDHWYFNSSFNEVALKFSDAIYDKPSIELVGYMKMIVSFYSDLFKGKIDMSNIFNNPNKSIGLNAILNKNGFMKDGTYYYGELVTDPSSSKDYNFVDTRMRIKKGNNRFQYCDTIQTSSISAIDDFLEECDKRKIVVLAFLPPYAPTIYNEMCESGRYKYINKIYPNLKKVFNKYPSCEIYDYTNGGIIGVSDTHYLDGFHGDALVYNQIMTDMNNKSKLINDLLIEKKQIDSINMKEIFSYHESKELISHK